MKTKTRNTKTKQAPAGVHKIGHEDLQLVSNSFSDLLRQAVRSAAEDMMAEEVVALCGERYRPMFDAQCRRAGSEMGVLRYDSRKEAIVRPRVRSADGRREVELQSYKQIKSMSNHDEIITKMVSEGLSCRGLSRASRATDRALAAFSKSAVAERWARKGAEHLETLRSTDLSQQRWAVLMVDGIFLEKELCVIVAIGVDWEGRKHVLDFESAASESADCAQRLLQRLVERGFAPPAGHRLLALTDGSKALHKALREQWPDLLLQECLVHVERHILDRLRRNDRGEAMRLFKRLRVAQGSQAAKEAYDELHKWFGSRHEGAQQSLSHAKERLLVVHALELGEELQRSLLSTNSIENVMRNLRQHGQGVKRWRTSGSMVSRWLASGLLWVQKGFHPVRGHEAMPRLIAALRRAEG